MFQAKFDWSEDETILYNTIISSAAIIGIAIGSFIGGGSLKKLGRRKTALLGNALAIVSSAICMIGTTGLLTIGRLLLGVSAGIANVVFGKMITENMPEKLVSKFAMVHNASINVGLVPAFVMGALLPDPDNLEANRDD